MTRKEKLYAMNGALLIDVADKLGVKVACNKTRNQLKEAKAKVIERILAAEAKATAATADEEFTTEEVSEIEARMACGESFDSAIQTVSENSETTSEAPISQSEEVSEKPKQKVKRSNLKLKELTYKGETKSIKEWAEEIEMPWPTLYDRVNRNGWTVEDAIETPLGQRRPR